MPYAPTVPRGGSGSRALRARRCGPGVLRDRRCWCSSSVARTSCSAPRSRPTTIAAAAGDADAGHGQLETRAVRDGGRCRAALARCRSSCCSSWHRARSPTSGKVIPMTSIELRNLTVAGQRCPSAARRHQPHGARRGRRSPSRVRPAPARACCCASWSGSRSTTSGDILIDDAVVTYAGPRARDLAMVFQDYALHPQLDVFDNLAFSATLRRGFDQGSWPSAINDGRRVPGARRAAGDQAGRPRRLPAPAGGARALARTRCEGYLFDEAFSAAVRARPHAGALGHQPVAAPRTSAPRSSRRPTSRRR